MNLLSFQPEATRRWWHCTRSRALLGLALAAVVGFGRPAARAGETSPGPGGETDPVAPATVTLQHPAPGAVYTAPARIVFEATAVDPAGDIRLVEFFANDEFIGRSQYLLKIAVIPGRPIPHRLVWEGVPAGHYRVIARAVDTEGNPVASTPLELRVDAAPTLGRSLVTAKAVWRYSNDGKDLGTAWRDPAFDDGAWPEGPAQLGYGDGDEATITRAATKPHPMTAYFRHAFVVPDPARIESLLLRLIRDDGAAVYLNGRPLLRDNLPDGELTFTTPAKEGTGTPENAVHEFKFTGAGLVPGRNVLAVEVHQTGVESSDLSFALEVLAWEAGATTSVAIVEPAAGSGHVAGLPLVIVARAIGPKEMVSTLEFYAGAERLGRSTTPTTSSDDGTAVGHRFLWPQPPAGTHLLTARTLPDAAGEVIRSEPVAIVVKSAGPDRPLVRIEAMVSETAEPSPNTRVRPGVLRISRKGDLGVALPVACALGGSATFGTDYALEPAPGAISTFTIPAGAEAVEVQVVAVDDERVEGPETVVVELTGMPFGAPLPDPYLIDPEARVAKVVIHDSDPTPTGATLVLTQPKPGETFAPGREIPIRATAVDPAGYLPRVEFYAGDQLLGVSEIAFLVPPEPGTPIEHGWVWKGAPEGIHMLTARTITSAGVKVVSETVRVRVAGPEPAKLVLTKPRDGDVFRSGGEIALHAVAVDPASYLPRVEFYAGDQLLGVSEIQFIVAPEPGTPIEHSLVWKDAPEGPHVLTARTVTSAGEKLISEPTRITVVDPNRRVVLAVGTADAEAREPGIPAVVDAGVFVVKRVSGPLDIEVTARYTLLGTAENGVDYIRLPGSVALPAGAESARVVVVARADDRQEGPETVVLRLDAPICPAVEPPPPGCYRVGEPAEAKLAILDEGSTDNQPPKVALLSPPAGGVFQSGEVIGVAAEAADPDGTIARLEVRDGEQLLGTAAAGALKFEWKDAAAGLHVLTARAVDNAGATAASVPVRILVRETTALSFVHRELPPAYAAGHGFAVALVAEPPRRGTAYALEDQPPAGWVVSEVSEGGAFDPVHGKVKFGPFTDREVRRLSYRVVPPVGAVGRQEFSGVSSLDGASAPILGDQAVEPAGEFHPADAKPQDHGITADELTAYAAAWKAGHGWPTDAGSVPLSFVTRAGAIWQAGESYTFQPEAGAPPLCWVPLPPTPKPGLAGGDVPGNGGGAERQAAGHCVAGDGNAVVVTIQPPAGTRAWAAEERVPAGWTVSEIAEGGTFDAAGRSLRWGLFLGDTPRTLSYRLTSPDGVASLAFLTGVVSFDGENRSIAGGRESLALPAGKELRIRGVQRQADGRVALRLGGQASQLVLLEASDDLQRWTEVKPVLLTGDETECEDAPGGSAPRFYRLRPAGP